MTVNAMANRVMAATTTSAICGGPLAHPAGRPPAAAAKLCNSRSCRRPLDRAIDKAFDPCGLGRVLAVVQQLPQVALVRRVDLAPVIHVMDEACELNPFGLKRKSSMYAEAQARELWRRTRAVCGGQLAGGAARSHPPAQRTYRACARLPRVSPR